MNRIAITERMADRTVQLLVPGTRARLGYRIAWNDYRLRIDLGDEFTEIKLQPKDLLLSIDDFSALLKSNLPPEWLPTAATP